MKDGLNLWKMKDDLIFLENGRQPQFLENRRRPQFLQNGRRPHFLGDDLKFFK